ITMDQEIYLGMVAFVPRDGKSTTAVWSSVEVSVLPSVLMPPSDLLVEANLANGLELRWVDNSDNEAGFVIERASSAEGVFEAIATLAANTTYYQDQGLSAGNYYYRVKAVKDQGGSWYSNRAYAEVLEFKNTILYMPRLAGDYDKAILQNEISVSTSSYFSTEEYMYTNMKGKVIDVNLEQSLSSGGGSISFKVTPYALNQTTELFHSENLSVSQVGDQIALTIQGTEWVSNSVLDTITCNHVVIQLSDQMIDLYVNGEWTSFENSQQFEINEFTLESYNGQLWDVRMHNRVLTEEEVAKISERCGTGISLEAPNPLRPQFIGGAYYCLWAKEDVDLSQSKYLYHLFISEYVYQHFVMEAGMYNHEEGLEKTLLRGRDFIVDDNDSWIEWSFSNPITKDDHNVAYVWHENFHSYQSKNPSAPYNGGKWLNEASANWGASYVVDNYPNKGATGITLYPHWPIGFYNKTYNIPGGNRDYHAYIFLSYITRFVSDPSFIGKVYNDKDLLNGAYIINVFKKVLNAEGHDFVKVFNDFAARTTVWDYQDGSGPDWERSEQVGIQNYENKGYTDFNHKFTHIMSSDGTNGVMTEIPEDLRPCAYSWNAYKIDSTAAGSYTIKFQGISDNPTDTKFQAMIVKGNDIAYEYIEMPISNSAAFGESVDEFQVSTQAGEELYWVVTSIPDAYHQDTTIRYDYTYSFEVNTTEFGLKNAMGSDLSQTYSLNNGALNVYPTITDGHLTIEMEFDTEEPAKVTLYNAVGRKEPLSVNYEEHKIEVGFDGSAGLYLLHVQTGQVNRVVKIIKK
ncbi:T9SS type A sorting domain-containing protein, partial [Saccharicrinis fermentans]